MAEKKKVARKKPRAVPAQPVESSPAMTEPDSAIPATPATSAIPVTPDEAAVPMKAGGRGQFPVAGIGCSAGGLEALDQLFRAMPSDTGMAFVLVAHLDPHHKSILPELIQKTTEMPVVQVKDNTRVEPDRVYIIPPNKVMAILHGSLQLLERDTHHGGSLPIDTFLRSLAQDQGDKAIGIILSGTGTDGTLGLRAIKGETGMTMVQEPDSAKYDGMPRSAIDTGLIDYVLPPDRMPEQLVNYVLHRTRENETETIVSGGNYQNCLQKIFVILRTRTGHDFSLYRQNTIRRRIEKRMHIHQIDTINEYVRYLQQSDLEPSILFKEMLIGVTSFFRDSEPFELLRTKHLPELLKEKPDGYPVRIWVPACSTGEEAYSIAMVLAECMADTGRSLPVQIFGTDLDEEAIAKARGGTYPTSIAADVSLERLRKFFTREDHHYKIKKKVREMVIFAPQNIIKDAPFTKLDMLCCRNLLIYFNAELQKKMLPLFHYGLKEDGVLFLGSSESIGTATDLFAMKDKKWKIYKRLPNARARHPMPQFPTAGPVAEPGVARRATKAADTSSPAKDVNTLKLLTTMLGQSGMPPCVVVNEAGDIIYIHGRTGRFLEPAEGEAGINNVLEMARPGLKGKLAGAIRQTAGDRRETVVKDVRVRSDGASMAVNLIVRPLPDYQAGRHGMMLIIFEEAGPAASKKSAAPTPSPTRQKSHETRKFEEELLYTRETLQTTIEEMETSNEELKSTNEELQSLNEESVTVNAELQARINELSAANDDIKNLLDVTEIATIFLDIDLNIRRFTPKATEIFPLTATDIGRPISHFASSLQDVDLHHHAAKVLNNLERQEVEVHDKGGTIYRMRVRPYRTVNNVIDGVVVIFMDITELQRLHEATRLAAVVRDSNDAITLLDQDGNILAWNRGAEKMYGYAATEALRMTLFDLLPRKRRDEAGDLLAELQEHAVESLVTERQRKDGSVVHVWLTASRVSDENVGSVLIATTERDLATLSQEALRQLTGKIDDAGK